ncbi:MAG: class I SAM-dependent methyltransferase [Gammaproteobacteria bacterium AqS3]|nr:class I SAM-dependent methyltransferase [Gammaproteobacteria bacterium AqS3]
MWNRWVLPHLLHCSCGLKPFRMQREKIVPEARGTVLEVGFGSGLNLPHYRTDAVDKIYALEPAEPVAALAEEAIGRASMPVELLLAGAEDIPLPSNCIDSVVCTYTLCTIPDLERSLAEIRRVLRPEGRFWFSEHGLAPDESVAHWQRRLDGLWSRIAGGCHLSRDAPENLRTAGWRIGSLDQMYLPGSKIVMYHSWGWASA